MFLTLGDSVDRCDVEAVRDGGWRVSSRH